MTQTISTSAPEQMTPGARRAVTASVLGTVIEWYDYALYGAVAGMIIGPLFFPSDASSAETFAALATFGVGFLARPLGGIVIGHLGDTRGRKTAMILTIVLMAGATVGMGLLPTAAQVGMLAPILLILLRFVQGFGAGAELSGAVTLVAEYVPLRRRGLFTGIVLAAPPAGISLATAAFFIVSGLSEEQLFGWGWRVPFLVSAVLFLVAFYIRRRLEETPEYVAAQELAEQKKRDTTAPLKYVLAKFPKQVVVGFLALVGHNAMQYTLATFSIGFMLSIDGGLDRPQALLAVVIGSAVAVVTTPFGGMLADRIGASKVMAAASLIMVVLSGPIFLLLKTGEFGPSALAIALGYALIITGTSGGQGALLSNLFPAHVRLSGMSFVRELNGALVAGFSPMIVAMLISAAGGSIWLAVGYLMLCGLISAVAILLSGRMGDNENSTLV
ncbi:MFS transporter [Brevibacterium sp. Marseille-P9724]|uniref:MFS transporter n=1 Tax=Brevibacterium sp. Marseille-P9724 TaxID=2614125 RepID=UPI00125FC066|nr:MFS transporter [Brevibacterium sp. Marseille-P9724]